MARARDVQADFAQLQREYRNMEQNRKAYTEESQNIIRRQQKSIDKLRKENESLKSELAMETRHASVKVSTAHASKLSSLQEQGNLYTSKIAIQEKNIAEINKQVKLLQEKILIQRKKMGGVNAARENQLMVQKQIRILENRLDKALVKFNEALAHNKNLREEIDNLRRERVVFDNIYRKLEKELHEKKKQMANIIEISNQAYEARDQAQMEIAAIQQADAKETQEYDEQMVSLGKQLEEDKRRKDMMLRDQARELEEAEEEMRNKSKRGGKWGNAMQEKAQAQASLEKVQSFEEAFNKIKAATGITDIDELVNTFIANEDQNFSLFNYVNEQNNEIEKLEEQMQNLHEEERKYAQESGEDVNQHKKLLNELAQRLKSTEVSAERFEMKYQDALKTINSLKIGIQSIFNKIGCNSSAMSEMLADSMVTEANMMQYLGMIEQRTNEILQLYATVSGPQPEEKGPDRQTGGADRDALVNVLGAGPMTPMGQELIQINPPNLNDYSSEEDSDDDEIEARPLTHEELKLKTMKVIHRRAANNVGKPPRGQQRRK
jgi:coiled-coil domain-containing protein 63/114|eukprot:Stramenopile-MAST_4_protein_2106